MFGLVAKIFLVCTVPLCLADDTYSISFLTVGYEWKWEQYEIPATDEAAKTFANNIKRFSLLRYGCDIVTLYVNPEQYKHHTLDSVRVTFLRDTILKKFRFEAFIIIATYNGSNTTTQALLPSVIDDGVRDASNGQTTSCIYANGYDVPYNMNFPAAIHAVSEIFFVMQIP